MTRDELLEAFRRRTKDQRQPYLWSGDDFDEYLTDAQNEAAERANLLRDTDTPEICELAIEADRAEYDLDCRVLEVLRAKLDSQQRPLSLTTTEAMDLDRRGWDGDEQSSGPPRRLVIDPLGAGWRARLDPVPSTDDMLRLQVYRLPLEPVKGAGKCVPEIHERYHIKLLDWVCFRAYSKHDSQTRNEELAAAYAADFAATFGEKRDAHTGRREHDSLHPQVRISPL